MTRVVESALEAASPLASDSLMLIGAWCRDILHRALGHDFDTTATRDLDLALGLSSWDAYRALNAAFRKIGHTGLRYRIADLDVDLLPSERLKTHKASWTRPPKRAVQRLVLRGDLRGLAPLQLSTGRQIRIPTIPGFAAAKLGAWLDRSVWGQTKDAGDIALILYWYSQSPSVQDRLYDTTTGNGILIREEADVPRAAAHLLGADVAGLIGPQRLAELPECWLGNSTAQVGPPSSPDARSSSAH
ncbi:MAG: hypothetical protein IPL43_13100 [Micropruina sp.]|nr:hypothetical protein [Micropruina sp.]